MIRWSRVQTPAPCCVIWGQPGLSLSVHSLSQDWPVLSQGQGHKVTFVFMAPQSIKMRGQLRQRPGEERAELSVKVALTELTLPHRLSAVVPCLEFPSFRAPPPATRDRILVLRIPSSVRPFLTTHYSTSLPHLPLSEILVIYFQVYGLSPPTCKPHGGRGLVHSLLCLCCPST